MNVIKKQIEKKEKLFLYGVECNFLKYSEMHPKKTLFNLIYWAFVPLFKPYPYLTALVLIVQQKKN